MTQPCYYIQRSLNKQLLIFSKRCKMTQPCCYIQRSLNTRLLIFQALIFFNPSWKLAFQTQYLCIYIYLSKPLASLVLLKNPSLHVADFKRFKVRFFISSCEWCAAKDDEMPNYIFPYFQSFLFNYSSIYILLSPGKDWKYISVSSRDGLA